MNILVANNHLEVTGGSENYTYTLAVELLRQGHRVEYYCDETKRGEFALLLEKNLGIGFKSRAKYDLILANHTSMLEELRNSGYLIQTCHGVFPLLEQPSPFADSYVAISEEVKAHLQNKRKESTLMLNGIDCTRFSPKTELNDKAQTVLSLCQGEEANKIVEDACSLLGLKFLHASKNTNNVFAIEELINKADIVVGVGRSLYDAMACGRACVSLDSRSYSTLFEGKTSGGDGYITLSNISTSIAHNLTGRVSGRYIGVEELVSELKKYDKADGADLRQYALKNLNIENSVKSYMQIYASRKRCLALAIKRYRKRRKTKPVRTAK